jgi:hypothetical protein
MRQICLSAIDEILVYGERLNLKNSKYLWEASDSEQSDTKKLKGKEAWSNYNGARMRSIAKAC